MACVPIPTLPVPTLPFPLSIEPPALPDVPLDAVFCCKIINYTIKPPPLPIFGPTTGIVLNPAVNAVIAANIKLVQNYLNQLQIPCPTEPVVQP